MDDLIIIGGSAAGSAAAVYAARRNLKVRVVSADLGGEVARSGEIENWPGVIHTTGIELATKFEEHLRSYDLPIETGVWIEKIDRRDGVFHLTGTKDGQPASYEAKSVLIATGVHPRLLKVPGEEELKNKGLSYCTVCDGPLFRNKQVITIGGGNSALESALMLAGLAQSVTILTINPELGGEAVLIDKLKALPNVTIVTNAETTKILGETVVSGVEYRDKESGETRELAAQGVFVHIGMIPNSAFVDVEKNQFGEIKVNQVCETNIPGLFAAGDVTDIPFKQIAIATGQGVTAALQIARYLDNLAS